MNKHIIFAFSIGAAIGSLVTWKAVKTKYERMAQEQIASMREVIAKKQKNTNDEPTDIPTEIAKTVAEHEESVDEYKHLIDEYGYSTCSKPSEADVDDDNKDLIYIIRPEQYGELEGYDGAELTYWAGDGVLTDDLDEPIEDIEGTIGYGSLNHFGEYEDDSVHVRNDIRRIDYEILLDPRSYSMAILEAK